MADEKIRYASKSGYHRSSALFSDMVDLFLSQRNLKGKSSSVLTSEEVCSLASIMFELDCFTRNYVKLKEGVYKKKTFTFYSYSSKKVEEVVDGEKTYTYVPSQDNPSTVLLTKDEIENRILDIYVRYRDLFISILKAKNYVPTSRLRGKSDEEKAKITGNVNYITRLPEGLKLTLWYMTYSLYLIDTLYKNPSKIKVNSKTIEVSYPLSFILPSPNEPIRVSDRGIIDFINEVAKGLDVGISSNLFQNFIVSPSFYFSCTNYRDIELTNKYPGEKKGYLAYCIRYLFTYIKDYDAVLDLFGGSGRASMVTPKDKLDVIHYINEYDFNNINYYKVLKDEKLCNDLVSLLKSWQDDLRKERELDPPYFKDMIDCIRKAHAVTKTFRGDNGTVINKNHIMSIENITEKVEEVFIHLEKFVELFENHGDGYRYSKKIHTCIYGRKEKQDLGQFDFRGIRQFDNISDIDITDFNVLAPYLENLDILVTVLYNFGVDTELDLDATYFGNAAIEDLTNKDKARCLLSPKYEKKNSEVWGKYETYSPFPSYIKKADLRWRDCYKEYNDIIVNFNAVPTGVKNQTISLYSKYVDNNLVNPWEDKYALMPDEKKVLYAASFIFLKSTLYSGKNESITGVTPAKIDAFIDTPMENYLAIHKLFKDLKIYNSDALYGDEFLLSNLDTIVEKDFVDVDTKRKNDKGYYKSVIYSDSPYLGTMGYGKKARQTGTNKKKGNPVKNLIDEFTNNTYNASVSQQADGSIDNAAMETLIEKLCKSASAGNEFIFSCRVNPKADRFKVPTTVNMKERDDDGDLRIEAFEDFSGSITDIARIGGILADVHNLYENLFLKFDRCMSKYSNTKGLYVLLCLQNPEKEEKDYSNKIDSKDLDYIADEDGVNENLVNFLLEDKFRNFDIMEVFITSFPFLTPLDYDNFTDNDKEYYIFKAYTYDNFLAMLRDNMFKCSPDKLVKYIEQIKVDNTKSSNFNDEDENEIEL